MGIFKTTAAARFIGLALAIALFSAFTLLDTSLRVEVLDTMGNSVEGALVTLYATEDDYRNGENPVQEGQYTDDKGRVVFKELEPQVYFLDVVKGDMDNVGMAASTNPLEEGRRNKVRIVIE